jgi:hypothetical protein
MKQVKRRRLSQRQMMVLQMIMSVLILFTKGEVQEICIIFDETLLDNILPTEVAESNLTTD